MSLILEALKKSEAKRRLGEAPDLETPFAAQRRRSSPLPFIVAAIIVAAGVGWWLLRTPAVPAGAVSALAPEKPLATSVPAVPVKPLAANPPTVTSAPPPGAPVETTYSATEMAQIAQWVPVGQGSMLTVGANRKRATAANGGASNPVDTLPAPMSAPKPPVVAPPAAAPHATATVALPPGVKKPEPAPEPVPVAVLKKPEPPAVAVSETGVRKIEPPPAAAPAAGMKKPEPAAPVESASGLPAYYELPFSVRKDLPPLKLSMHVYAPEPAQRFIILNDSRMVEGNSQEDLALREIRPDGAVFEFKGQRFFYPRDGL
jgi:general secretion pathway protein B